MLETLHLNEEFSLDTPCRLRLIFTSRRAKRIDLINKYDARLVFSSQIKQIANKPNRQHYSYKPVFLTSYLASENSCQNMSVM